MNNKPNNINKFLNVLRSPLKILGLVSIVLLLAGIVTAWTYTNPPRVDCFDNGTCVNGNTKWNETTFIAESFYATSNVTAGYYNTTDGRELQNGGCDASYCIRYNLTNSSLIEAVNGSTGKVDFKGTDSGAVTQSVHDIMPNGTIKYRNGDFYFVTEPTINRSKVNLKGEGYKTAFHLGNGNTGNIISFSNADQFTISDIMFWGGNANKAQLKIVGGSQYTLSNLQFYNFYGYGLEIDTSTHYLLSNLYTDSSNSTGDAIGQIGIWMHGTPASNIIEGHVRGYITERVDNSLKATDFTRSEFSGITATHSSKETNSSRALYLINGTNSTFSDIIASDWLLSAIDATNVNYSTFSNIQSRNNTNHGLLLTNSYNNTIQGIFQDAPTNFAGVRLVNSSWNKIHSSIINNNNLGIKESGTANNNSFELNTVLGGTPYTITGSGTMALELDQSTNTLRFYNTTGWRTI